MRAPRDKIKGEYKAADPRELPDVQVGRHKAKKDTKRWCLGHVGREHDPRWVADEKRQWWIGHYPSIWVFKCQRCHKEMGYRWCDESIVFHPATKTFKQWASFPSRSYVVLEFYGPGLPREARHGEPL